MQYFPGVQAHPMILLEAKCASTLYAQQLEVISMQWCRRLATKQTKYTFLL